jgi:outer membrane protein
MNKTLQLLVLCLTICGCGSLMVAGQSSGDSRVLTLREAVRLALAHKPEVLMAVAEAAKSAEGLREVRAANLPQVTVGTGLAYNNGFPLSIEGSAPSIFQAAISQAIFSKKNKNLVRESQEGNAALQANTDTVRNEVIAKTILIYNELYQADALIPFLREQQGAAEKSVEVFENLLEAGRVRPLDISLKRMEVRNYGQQLLVARERLRMASVELHALTGIADTEAIRTERPDVSSELLSMPAEQLYRRALETHPGIHEAEANIRARERHLEAEKGEAYPQVDLISQYALFSKANNYQDYFNQFTRNNYILGLSVQFPVFNGNRTGSRLAQSRKDVEIARLQLARLKEDLKLNLERAESAVRIAAGEVELARMQVSVFEQKLRVGEAQIEAGRIEPAELTQTRAQLVEKRAAVVEAERALLEKQVVLLQASGSLISLF